MLSCKSFVEWVNWRKLNKCNKRKVQVNHLTTPPRHMGSHSVTCHPAAVNFSPLPQPKLVLNLKAIPKKCKAQLTRVVVISQDSFPPKTVTYLRNNVGCDVNNRPGNDACLSQFLQLQHPPHLTDVIMSVELDGNSADVDDVVDTLWWRRILVKQRVNAADCSTRFSSWERDDESVVWCPSKQQIHNNISLHGVIIYILTGAEGNIEKWCTAVVQCCLRTTLNNLRA